MCLQMVEKIATEGVANFSVNKNTLPFFREARVSHVFVFVVCAGEWGFPTFYSQTDGNICLLSRHSDKDYLLSPSLPGLDAGSVFGLALSGAGFSFFCEWLFLRWKNVATRK